ncbi:hypothetical protein HZS55_21545 [Halosimplex rubrum]|uniref:Uncharacterized protein n=1 Tax=Halosimplex rubrum TaxID=869889 RepID=A0A7D5TES4_9EURY|nr:hypothetical protein [Halosimplex rubrum]QLH79716.1 hypothetical protein HZS55_21545 [Halosimplex rubrum]
MNRHFQDTLYYLKRAGETARKGVSEELAPVEKRVRGLTGREREPEPGRVEAVRERVAGEANAAVGDVREAVGRRRSRDTGSQ